MKFYLIIFSLFFCQVFAQRNGSVDSLKLRDVTNFFADDYGSVYLYKKKDFSFTKFDSLGTEQGRMMLVVPYKVQGVQNPLNIVLFSENAQEMKFVDHNLNQIQKLELNKFGFVKMAYAEDQQQIWILDESAKRLVQYNFREDKIINSYPFFMDFAFILDMVVFENRLYLLSEKKFEVYDLKSNKLFEKEVENGKKLRRENEIIYIITDKTFYQFLKNAEFREVFKAPDAKIVDKNSSAFFELRNSLLYLYPIEKR